MKREQGHYWVKLRGKWLIALWTTTYWVYYLIQDGYFDGHELIFSDSLLDEIDENQITRQEPIKGEDLVKWVEADIKRRNEGINRIECKVDDTPDPEQEKIDAFYRWFDGIQNKGKS